MSYHGEAVHRASYGFRNVEAQQPVDGRTQFPIGTMAKTFTASAVAALVADGRLQWTTRVKDVVPELDTRSPTVTENLTITDLLAHRASLGRSNLWWQGADATLLLDKKDIVRVYNTLPPAGQFRADWAYSNWGYALAGEVIERVSGKSYAQFLREAVFAPLGLRDTTAERVDAATAPNYAQPYAAMDDARPHRMPQPPVHGRTIMGPAMGGVSSAEDLLTYATALLRAFRHESGAEKAPTEPLVKHGLMQLSGHIFTAKGALEKSYALGWYRTQLPNTVLGMGWNSLYVRQMPAIEPRGHAGPLIAHGGSLPGYHVAVALLPVLDAAVVVCTNSIALGDVSGWTAMALVEALVDSPRPADYAALAAEAAGNARLNVQRFREKLDAAKTAAGDTAPRPHGEYVGRYRDTRRDWVIEVRESGAAGADGLEVRFQGLASQAWALRQYERDTFLWLASREEQARRGRMVTYPLVPDHFKLAFEAGSSGKIERLLWKHEAGVPAEQQYFEKEP